MKSTYRGVRHYCYQLYETETQAYRNKHPHLKVLAAVRPSTSSTNWYLQQSAHYSDNQDILVKYIEGWIHPLQDWGSCTGIAMPIYMRRSYPYHKISRYASHRGICSRNFLVQELSSRLRELITWPTLLIIPVKAAACKSGRKQLFADL